MTMSVRWDHMPLRVTDGLTQMAIDCEMAHRCAGSPPRAIFRLYWMDPPAVTIGRHQRWRDVIDPKECRRRGWDWARRPTGGGALLHQAEINYAVAASRGVFAGGDTLRAAYAQIMGGLRDALERLGCHPVLNLGRVGSGTPILSNGLPTAHGLCERSLTRYEITVNGRKAVAAAQWHLPEAVLQHGTIYLRAPDPADRFWPQRSSDEDLSGPAVHWWDLSEISMDRDQLQTRLDVAIRDGLAHTMGAEWQVASADCIDPDRVSNRLRDWRSADWNNCR
jgi:lipoate-protein ligase A